MSLQVALSKDSLVAAGVAAGDLSTLVGLAYRFGNWVTAEKGDADFLTLIEEQEFNFLRRQGVIDIMRFQKRWDQSIRILENGKPQRLKGEPVENLLCSASHWTVMMTCIVAALDEFASASTVRSICKALLERLFSIRDLKDEAGETQDLLDSSLQIRLNGWRSAAVVREMNVECRKIRDEFLAKGLVIQGHMPASETQQVSDFLFWLINDKTEVYHTSSSDLAAIAYCLCSLSFEVLSIENFGPPLGRETSCCLTYGNAPLYTGSAGSLVATARHLRVPRELATTVSLSQPEEAFSSFPITATTANQCRYAWQMGAKAGEVIKLGPGEAGDPDYTPNDLIMTFRNEGTPVSKQRRNNSGTWRITSLVAVFNTEEVNRELSEVLRRVPPDLLTRVAEVIKSNSAVSRPGFQNDALSEPMFLEAFTTTQAFFMGYYYQVFSRVIDTSTLEVNTVSGCWGYRSSGFLHRIYKSFTNNLDSSGDMDLFSMTRTDVLSYLATLYACMDVQLPRGESGALGHIESCAGVVGKRIILINSLLNNCESLDDLFRFVILDCDAGGLPRTQEGLLLTGIPPKFPTWDLDGTDPPRMEENVILRGSTKDCTRHIEVNWDGLPEHMLLCIRYNGRRVGSLNPIHADIIFQQSYMPPLLTPLNSSFVSAHTCSRDDLTISGRLVAPGRANPRTPVVVHTKGNPCLRYAVAAWYSDVCDVVFVTDTPLHQAFEYWQSSKRYSGKFVALIG